MKEKSKQFFGFVLTVAITFVFIYLFVFFGGWKYFESSDPIKAEIGVSVILGALIWFVLKLYGNLSSRIKKLEDEFNNNSDKEEES